MFFEVVLRLPNSVDQVLSLFSFLLTLSINILSVNDFAVSTTSRKEFSSSYWRVKDSLVTRGKLPATSSASWFLPIRCNRQDYIT